MYKIKYWQKCRHDLVPKMPFFNSTKEIFKCSKIKQNKKKKSGKKQTGNISRNYIVCLDDLTFTN